MWVITGRKAEVSFRHDWSRESMRGRGCVNLDGGGDGVGYWGLARVQRGCWKMRRNVRDVDGRHSLRTSGCLQ